MMNKAVYAVIVVTILLGSGTLKAKKTSQPRIGDKSESRSNAVTPKTDQAAFKIDDLYSEGPGTNPSFKELIDQGKVIVGSNKGKGIKGTKIDVNNGLLESNLGDLSKTLKPKSIHTHVRSGIGRKEFSDYSRWYQEDGNTQIFRLFKGEQSVRSKNNMKAGRIEACYSSAKPKPGSWIEWQATYAMIKGPGGCMFQLMSDKDPKTGQGGLWAVHIDSNKNGDIMMLRRRPKKGEKKNELIAKNAFGKNVTVKVLYDGNTKYEVYRKIHGQDKDFVFVGKGTYAQNGSDKVGLRWGMYHGSKPGSSISADCILFVTGVKVSYIKR